MTMHLSFGEADERHVAAITALRIDAARELAERYGEGHWAHEPTDRGVRASFRHARILIARRGAAIVATCRLASKKPWAIDTSYFTTVAKPVYLTDMAVRPDYQRSGVGRALLVHAREVALSWPKGPAQAIRLDAYDADAGAGEFYRRCGYVERGHVTYRGVPLVYYEQLLTPSA